jgi:hypothetical protein
MERRGRREGLWLSAATLEAKELPSKSGLLGDGWCCLGDDSLVKGEDSRPLSSDLFRTGGAEATPGE